MAERQFPPDGAIVRLTRHTRVRDDGRVLAGGSPTRVARISAAGAARLVGRELEVRDPIGRALARHLLRSGMGSIVASSLPPIPLAQLTVVVPAHDSPGPLARLLASIPAGVARTIVVDDASRDSAALARAAHASGAEVLVLPRNGGPAVARNAGLHALSTPFVAFVDSDVVLEPRSLEVLMRHFGDPEVALAAPRVLGLAEAGAGWISRYEDARSSLDLGADAGSVRPGTRVSWVPGACLVGRVAALGEGFDPAMRVGEDVDLVWRLAEAGHRIVFDPAVVVRHEHRKRLLPWAARKFAYGTGAPGLARRHPRDIAPVVLPPWAIALLVVLGAQRRWSLPVAAGLTGVVAARIAARIPHVTRPERLAVLLTADGVVATIGQGAALLVRHWWPPALFAALVSRRARRAMVVAAIADAAVEYARLRPRLDPLRFAVARRLDDLAYGAGAWWASLRSGSLRALLPAVAGAGPSGASAATLRDALPRCAPPAGSASCAPAPAAGSATSSRPRG